MGIGIEEQETIITFARTDGTAEVYTSDATMITKLDKLCERFPDMYSLKVTDKLDDGTLASKTYVIANKKMVSLRGKTQKRTMTEEQRQAAVERAKKMREKKNVG